MQVTISTMSQRKEQFTAIRLDISRLEDTLHGVASLYPVAHIEGGPDWVWVRGPFQLTVLPNGMTEPR